jgi:hypothetical protein
VAEVIYHGHYDAIEVRDTPSALFYVSTAQCPAITRRGVQCRRVSNVIFDLEEARHWRCHQHRETSG